MSRFSRETAILIFPDLSNMLAVSPPPKTFAGAFEMTDASKGYPVHLAGITRALEFMDTGLKSGVSAV